MKAEGYSYSVIGSRRSNQDSFLVSNETQVFAVADGVGGGLDGDVASQMAVKQMSEVRSAHDLRGRFKEAQAEILKESHERHGNPVMGTTLTTAHVSNDGVLSVCHIGDSRCYLFDQGCLQQLTEDQEYFDEELKSPILASYLGIPKEMEPLKLVESSRQLKGPVKLLLCSDGLYKQMNETRMAVLMNQYETDPAQMVQTMAEEAAVLDYSDNVTLVYVAITQA